MSASSAWEMGGKHAQSTSHETVVDAKLVMSAHHYHGRSSFVQTFLRLVSAIAHALKSIILWTDS